MTSFWNFNKKQRNIKRYDSLAQAYQHPFLFSFLEINLQVVFLPVAREGSDAEEEVLRLYT